jgi:ABC-type sugar transport system permease subunit
MFRFRGVSTKRTFVGPQYFQNLWTDETFWRALTNGLSLVVIGGSLIIGLALLLGHATTGRDAGSKILRSVYLFPQVVSVVAVAVLWRFVFHPSAGFLKGPDNGWLGDTKTAWPIVIFVFVWMSLGFYIMLFGAGISGIPKEIDEAAQLEGVTGFAKFRTVTWPLLWSIRRVAVVYVVINAMNCFALVNVMVEGGGPANSAEVMLNYLYELMQASQFGKASALAVVNFFVALALSLVVMLLFRRNPEDGRKVA